jgi:hypothetical protein
VSPTPSSVHLLVLFGGEHWVAPTDESQAGLDAAATNAPYALFGGLSSKSKSAASTTGDEHTDPGTRSARTLRRGALARWIALLAHQQRFLEARGAWLGNLEAPG